MKHYKYRLLDFINEEKSAEADTKQFNNGDSDTGEQAGKPDAKETQGDYNLKQVANAVAAAVKSHTDAKAKLDAKNLQASGKLKVKAGKNVSIAGQAQVDIKTGKADFAVPIKIKDKEVNLNIQGLNISNPKDLHGKDIKGSFIDPVTNKEITIGVNIDPDKDKYSFSAGETKGKTSFDVTLNINKSNFTAGGNVGFDSQDFIPSKFAPKVSVGVEYDNEGGFAGNVSAQKDFKTRSGNVSVSAQGKAGGGERYGGVGVTYTPDKKGKKQPQDKTGKLVTKGMKKATRYVDFGDESKAGGLKTVKTKDGEEVTKVQKKVGDIKKDVESAAVKTQKTVDKLKEGNVTMTKRELSILIESMLKF